MIRKLSFIVFLLTVCPEAWASMSRVQFLHQYPATSGTGYAFGSNNTAGNLLIAVASASGTTSFTFSDSLGNSWTHLTAMTSPLTINIAYVLNAKGGANSVTLTSAGSDLGFTVVEVNATGGATWAIDSSLTSGSTTAGTSTNSPRSNNYSTAGSDDYIFMAWGDENADMTITSETQSFTLINHEVNHADAQFQWLDAGPQTSISSGFNGSTTDDQWGLYIVAFTASGGGATCPKTRALLGVGC